MKLLFTLLFFTAIIGTVLGGTYQIDADQNVGIKTDQLTDVKHRGGNGRGRGGGRCSTTSTVSTVSTVANGGFTPPTVLPTTTRVSTLSSLLPFPPFTAPIGQTPFPNIDVRDTELLR